MIGALLLIGLAAPVRAEPPGALPTTRAAADPHFAAFNGDGYSDLAVAGTAIPRTGPWKTWSGSATARRTV